LLGIPFIFAFKFCTYSYLEQLEVSTTYVRGEFLNVLCLQNKAPITNVLCLKQHDLISRFTNSLGVTMKTNFLSLSSCCHTKLWLDSKCSLGLSQTSAVTYCWHNKSHEGGSTVARRVANMRMKTWRKVIPWF